MRKLPFKQRFLLTALAGAWAVSGCAHSQQLPTPVVTSQVAAEEVELGGPALWKVADEDTTIYLFGTVHALPKDVAWYQGAIADALQSSDRLITEIYIPKGSEGDVGAAFISRGSLPAGQNLRDLLDDEQKIAYEAAMGKMGLPAASFDQFEPWLAAVNMSMIPLLQAGYSPDSGVEKILEGKAGEIARGELESVDFQIDLFDNLPMDSQLEFMMGAVEGVDEIVPMLDAMVGEWIDGDPEGLAVLMNEDLTDPVLADAILYSRNRSWAEWIDTRLDSPGTVFIAVGAGHLAGEESVQAALVGRGIKSIRVQ